MLSLINCTGFPWKRPTGSSRIQLPTARCEFWFLFSVACCSVTVPVIRANCKSARTYNRMSSPALLCALRVRGLLLLTGADPVVECATRP